jgi:hypothetical protein
MSTGRQIAERRRCNRGISAGRHIVLCRPCARIQLVMEGIVILPRQVRQHLETHVRRRRQGEVDLHLAGGGIRRRGEVLGTVVGPLDGLAAGGRRIVHHYEG